MPPAQLLTIAAYARHRGCDEKAVRKALKEGRITRAAPGRHCIDPTVADLQWAANTRPRADSGRRQPRAAAGGAGAAGAGAGQPPAEGVASYHDSRAMREAAEAQRAQLEVGRMAGQLIDRAEGERAAFDFFRALRDATENALRDAADRLVGLTDVREIEHILLDTQRAAFAAAEARMQQLLAQRSAGR